MKKKILAAAVCAAAVLGLTGCANNADTSALMDIASKAANETSKSTSSAATSKSGATSSAATSSTSTTSETSKPTVNLMDWDYSTREYTGSSDEITIQINGYKGKDEKIEIPAEINGLKVTTIGERAFQNNIDITSVTIPESITYIDAYAFDQCLNLSDVTFKGDVPNFSYVGNGPVGAFSGTPWLEAKKAESSNLLIINDTLVKGIGCEGDITIPDGVKKINKEAFNWDNRITGVTIPDSVIEIGDSAFHGTSLSSVTIPDSVTIIGKYAFAACSLLQSVNIPQNIVTIGGSAFGSCDKLVGRFTLPDSIRTFGYKETVMSSNFYSPFDYSNIELVFKGTTYKGYDGYVELYDAIVQNGIAEDFGTNDVVITDNILMRIKPGVTKIELPDTVKGIDDKAFEGCNQSIIITFKGKNYNLPNIDKLKADVSAN